MSFFLLCHLRSPHIYRDTDTIGACILGTATSATAVTKLQLTFVARDAGKESGRGDICAAFIYRPKENNKAASFFVFFVFLHGLSLEYVMCGTKSTFRNHSEELPAPLCTFSPHLYAAPPLPPVPSLPLDSLSSSREIASITIVKGSHVFKRSRRLAVLVCYYKGEGDKLVKGGEEGDETGRGALRAPRRGSRPFDHPLFFALREEIVL